MSAEKCRMFLVSLAWLSRMFSYVWTCIQTHERNTLHILFHKNNIIFKSTNRFAHLGQPYNEVLWLLNAGGYVWPPSLTFFALSFLIAFFHSVGNRLLIQGKLLRTEYLLFRLRYFQKTLFFYHTTTYSRVCSSDHTCTKTSFLVGVLGLGVIYS